MCLSTGSHAESKDYDGPVAVAGHREVAEVGWRVSDNSAPARGEVPAGLLVLAPGGLRPIRKPPSMSDLR
jgi:hypothetical protein